MTADIQLPSLHRIPTYTNSSKAIMTILGYHAITVVIEGYVHVDKYRLLLI